MDAATGKRTSADSSYRRYAGTCAGVMRMSADDYDQADQQHEVAGLDIIIIVK